MLRLTVGVTDVGGHAPNALATAAVHTAPSIGADSPAQQLVRNPVRGRHLLQQVTVAGALVSGPATSAVVLDRQCRAQGCSRPTRAPSAREDVMQGGVLRVTRAWLT